MVNWYAYFGNVHDAAGDDFYYDYTDELFDGDLSYDSAIVFDAMYAGPYSNNSLVVEFPQAIPIRTIYLWI